MAFTESVRSFHVPATPVTVAWPPSFPSVPTSRATRVTSAAKPLSWSTIVLMVSFSSRISPRTSTVILRDRSPLATAVVTSAMLRTWLVRLDAMEFTLSVRSFHTPDTPVTSAWPPSFPSVPTSRATRVTSEANDRSWSTIVLMASLSCRISPRTSTVILRDRSPSATAVVTSAMLRTWPVRFAAMEFTFSVRSFQVPAMPGTMAWPPSLPSVPTSRATRVTSEANDRSWSTIVLMVSFSCRISPRTSTVILRDRSPLATAMVTSADVAHLAGEIRGHRIHVVGEILPGAGDAGHGRLAAELSFGAYFARHARHFGGERSQLVHHRVDGFLELQDFAAHVHRDLARQVAVGHRRGHLGDVAHLAGEVAGHAVHVVGEIFPGAGDAGHDGLAAQLSFGAYFARHARHFGGERTQLIHHRVDGFLQLQDFAAHVHRDLARQVAVGHGDRHFGDVAHLAGQVRGHGIHVVGEIFPHAAGAEHRGLAAQLSFGADFARHARHFGGEHAHLRDHFVDHVRRTQELALERPTIGFEPHALREIALGHRGNGSSNFSGGPQQIVDERVDGGLHLAPRTGAAFARNTNACLAFLAHHLSGTFELGSHALVGAHHLIECVGDLAAETGLIWCKTHTEITITHGLKRPQQLFEVEFRRRRMTRHCHWCLAFPSCGARRRAAVVRPRVGDIHGLPDSCECVRV